jgi:hypothetical protein
MIVNPGKPGGEELLGLDDVFFGDDGYIYQLQELDDHGTAQELNEVYLGEDGTLYRLADPAALGKYQTSDRESFARYFLGDDGTLYEAI